MRRKGKAMRQDAIETESAALLAQRVIVEERMVENPMTTDGLVDAAIQRGEERPRWTAVLVNAATTMGGMARIKGLGDAQKAAVSRYRSLYDRAQIGGARATDYAAVRVDVSGSGHDVGEDGASARREYLLARRAVGPFQASLLDRVICEDASLRELARALGEPNGGSGTMRVRKRLLQALDELVLYFGPGARRRILGGGARAEDWTVAIDGEEPQQAH
jgi:hypothetical protein